MTSYEDFFTKEFATQLDTAKKEFQRELFDTEIKPIEEDKLVFLGTGMSSWVTYGGSNYVPQRTGAGLRVVMDGIAIHIDPGYLAAAQTMKYCGVAPIDGIVGTHVHPDGVCGLQELLFYAGRGGLRKQKPVLMGNKTLVEGFELDGKQIRFLPNDPLFVGNCSNIISLAPGDEYELGKLKLIATPVDHPEWFRKEPAFSVNKGIGLKIVGSKFTVSYVGETSVHGTAQTHWGQARSLTEGSYDRSGESKLDQIAEAHQGADILICPIASLVPNSVSPGNHMRIDGVYELANIVKPKKLFLTDISAECDMNRMTDLSDVYDTNKTIDETFIRYGARALEDKLGILVRVMSDGTEVKL